ncbi:polyadenylate-binding protein 1A-like [Hemibagrus wyckioides]|uniref:polyadenylate-binding protein 1A-like n=1 Tax=Hemibagrus wyckioides TaxID=337641 RepID=UPI00266CEAE9|nr:polyadenylate-binding protein 1A-like [Hemibagrus wyckioides]
MAALFVKDLHPEVSEVILSNRFRPAGHVQSVHICRDRKIGSLLGYAYINFRYRDDAERAIDMFNFELLLGRPMRVMWSNWEPTAKPIKGGNIFIRNLDWSIDCTSLFDTFSVFGRIVSCKVVESKGYGYVQYESAEAAALAIERLNGKLLNDRQVFLAAPAGELEVVAIAIAEAELVAEIEHRNRH